MDRIIYALQCPFTDKVHYIGKSEVGILRPTQHLSKSHSDKINDWVEELKVFNESPKVRVCEYVPLDVDIYEREKYWISKYIKKGNLLLNVQSVSYISIMPNFESVINDGDKFSSTISTFVKAKRKEVNLTQEQFADRSGVALSVIRKIEQKQENLTLLSVLNVLRMFGHTLDIRKIKPKEL